MRGVPVEEFGQRSSAFESFVKDLTVRIALLPYLEIFQERRMIYRMLRTRKKEIDLHNDIDVTGMRTEAQLSSFALMSYKR